MREKMIEVLRKADRCNAEYCKDCEFSEDLKGCVHRQKEIIADCLLANGVTIPVRCKDCIHYDFGVCLKIYSDGAVSQYAWQARNEDDFCSYGERKDNDNL